MGRPLSASLGRILGDDEALSSDETYVTEAESVDLDAKSRTVFLIGDITEQSAANAISRLVMLSQMDSKPIRLVINTYGGALDESLAIYDTMKQLRAPVRTIGIGKIMSAGVLLLAAGEKGHRMIGAHARIMIHNAYSGFVGDPYEIESEYNEFKRLSELENGCLIAETKLTKKKLEQILKSRLDHYVTPEQAISYGIADKLTA